MGTATCRKLFALALAGAAAGLVSPEAFPDTSAPQPGDLLVGFEFVARGDPDTQVGAGRVSMAEELLWGDETHCSMVASSEAVERAPACVDDAQGGVIVTYEYAFTAGEHAGDVDIVAVHLDKTGKTLWPAPKPAFSSGSSETRPIAISDGHGGAIVACEGTGPKGADAATDSGILAQRIRRDGDCLRGSGTSPSAVASSMSAERNACLVPDGQGGAIAVCEWVGADGDVDIVANRVSAEGPSSRTGATRPWTLPPPARSSAIRSRCPTVPWRHRRVRGRGRVW